MKRTKNIFLMLLITAFVLPMLNSCKKGEDDPFLSLKSRKSRLTGEWTLVSGTETNTYASGSTSVTYTVTYSSGMATVSGGGGTDTYIYSETFAFEKDNSFKATVNDEGDIIVIEGFWSFLEGWDEVKDKEAVMLRISKQTYTSGGSADMTQFSGDEMPSAILRFSRLANKECTIINDGQEVGSTTSTTKSEKNYEKK